MAALLPATFDEHTVPTLIAALDRAFYPPPSPGFAARMVVLWVLTAMSMLLAANYLWLHYRTTSERPRRRSLWLVRIVDRPSGRYIVVNPRPAWSCTVLFYGLYELAFLGLLWRVYALHRPQRAWIGVRSFSAVALFIGGWIISWSGLHSFILAVEAEYSCISARLANCLFLGVGSLILFLHIGLGIATTIFTERLFTRFLDLRAALVALETSLAGRVPTLLDFFPLQAPAEAFGAAGSAARMPNIVQWSLVTLFPLAILLVDFGGLALARRLRWQIKDSIELLAHADSGANCLAQISEVPTTIPVQLSPSAADGAESPGAPYEPRKLSLTSSDTSAKRKPLLTPSQVRALALQRRQSGGAAAARAQARKVLALQKAARDLQAVTLNIAVITVCLLGMAIWVTYCAATDKFTNGQWEYIEGVMMPPQWLYTVAVNIFLLYLTFNALRSRRRLLPNDESTTMGTAPHAGRSVICNFAEAGSVERSVKIPDRLDEEDELVELAESGVRLDKDELGELDGDGAGTPGDSPPVEGGARRTVAVVGGHTAWPLLRQKSTVDGTGSRRLGWPSLPARSRPLSTPSTGQAILVTIETAQVCDGDTGASWLADAEDERGSAG